MSIAAILAVLELINRAIAIGGEIVPIALRAYAAIKAETGMTDDQLIAEAEKLNQDDAAKLTALLTETAPE